MSKFANAILAAESISTKAEKFAVLSGFGPQEKRLLWETFNNFRVFGIRKYDWPTAFAAQDPSYDNFFTLLEMLATRQLTGTAAKNSVTAVLGSYTENTAKALARVLNKDLDCGANRDSFEKIYDDLDIPKFELMLASKIEEIAEETAASRKQKKVVLTEKILNEKYGLFFPVLAESKYDGNRLVAIVADGEVEYLSRSGKPSDHCTGLFDDELLAMAANVGEPIVVDGEVLGRSFQETMNAKGSKGDDAKAGLRFYAFDWMTLKQWKAANCPFKQSQRSDSLKKLIADTGCSKVIKSKFKICHNIAELRAFNMEVLEEGQNDDGTLNGLGEGLIIKALDGYYEWERSEVKRDKKTKVMTKGVFWVKWKPVIDLDLELVGFEYGKGRLSKTVGKLHLRGKDENSTEIEAKCGSGLNDKMRAYILANWSKLVGSTVCIEAQEISLAKNATIHSARFPIFIRFRDDK